MAVADLATCVVCLSPIWTVEPFALLPEGGAHVDCAAIVLEEDA